MHSNDLPALIDAVGISADPRKLAVMIVGSVATWAPVLLLLGLARQPQGGGVAALLGVLVLWVGSSITSGVVVKMGYDQLATGIRLRWRDALRFVLAHLDGFLFGPILAVCGVLLLLATELAVLFFGRVPYLGELLFSLVLLPILALNFAAALVVVFGSWLLFPIVAAEGATAMRSVMRVVEIVRQDPSRVLILSVVGFFLAVTTMAVLSLLLILTVGATTTVVTIGLGPEKALQLLGTGPLSWLTAGGLGGIPSFRAPAPPVTVELARFLLSLSLGGFFIVVNAFPSVFLLTTSCAVYLAVRPQPSPTVASPAWQT